MVVKKKIRKRRRLTINRVNFFINYVPSKNALAKDTKLNANYGEKRQYYSCSKNNSYLSYVEKGTKEKDYINYSGDSKKSVGVFNKDGLLDDEQIKELRLNLRQSGSPIWHGLISFEEVFGKEYCGSYEQAYELMKAQFNKFLKNAKFNVDNIEWFAGLHTNTEHRHIHFSFYEKDPQKKRYKKDGLYYSKGKINQFAISRLKTDFELKMISDKNILKERDALIKNAKNILGGGIGKELYRDIEKLMDMLPKDGRLSYYSDNLKSFRKDINYVATRLIRGNSELSHNYDMLRDKALEVDLQIMEVFGHDSEKYKYHLRSDKYINDIKARVGNVLLKFIKDFNFAERQKEYVNKNRLVEKRIKKSKRKRLINKMNYLSEKVNRESFHYLNELLYKLESIRYEQFKKEKDDFEM